MFRKSNQRSEVVKLQIKTLEAERDSLNDELQGVRDELATLKQKKKMEDEDIRHLVKIKEEKLNIEHQKRELERDRQKEAEIAKVKDEYRDKMERELQKQIDRMKDMYGEILQRLPNVNVRLKGDV